MLEIYVNIFIFCRFDINMMIHTDTSVYAIQIWKEYKRIKYYN